MGRKESDLVGPGVESGFLNAEEIRLFYVALTLAPYEVYLIYNPKTPSKFVEELMAHFQFKADSPVKSVSRSQAIFSDNVAPFCEISSNECISVRISICDVYKVSLTTCN